MNSEDQLEAWSAWKTDPNGDNTNRLLDMFMKDVISMVYTFKNADIPDYIVEAEATRNAIKAFDSYDPSKDTALRTHVKNYLKKTNRLVYDTQNVAKIPEDRVLKIQKYKNSVSELTEKLNRTPSALEVGEELGWDINEVKRMRKSLIPGGLIEGSDIAKQKYNFVTDSALKYIYYSLPKDMKPLFECITGYAGQPILSPQEIKTKLRLSDKEYRRKRSELQKFLKRHRFQELL